MPRPAAPAPARGGARRGLLAAAGAVLGVAILAPSAAAPFATPAGPLRARGGARARGGGSSLGAGVRGGRSLESACALRALRKSYKNSAREDVVIHGKEPREYPRYHVVPASADAITDFPYHKERFMMDTNADVPWPVSHTELVIDAVTVAEYFQGELAKTYDEEGYYTTHDPWTIWPYRIFHAASHLMHEYGTNRPPSPWSQVIVAYDLPDSRRGYEHEGARKGRYWDQVRMDAPVPDFHRGITFALAQSYVRGMWTPKQHEQQVVTHRCDREILYMLEFLTRTYPRKIVVVTGDRELGDASRRYATVRSPEWFAREVLRVRNPDPDKSPEEATAEAEAADQFLRGTSSAPMRIFERSFHRTSRQMFEAM